MHIAYLSPAWPPAGAANGIVTYVSLIRDYLLRQGHEVSVVADGRLHLSDGSARDLDPPAAGLGLGRRLAARLDRRLGHQPFKGQRLAEQLRRARQLASIDLIEMEESFGWSAAVRRRLDVPVITRLHGPHFLKPPGTEGTRPIHRARHREEAEGRAIREAAVLSAPSRAILRATCDRYGLSAERHGEVIPNPVRPASAEERWRLDGCDRTMILCVGRLDQAKGADTVILAFERLLERRPETRLVMVGPEGRVERPDGGSVPFMEHIRPLVAPATLKRVEFAGLLVPEDIRALRRQAYVTVVASLCENFPYAAVEAMAIGSPLISTEWAGSTDIIDHDRNGWLTPVGDPARMAERLDWVFAHPDAAAAAGEAAWRNAHDVYAIDRVGERMIGFYQTVLTGHARP